MKWLQKHRYLQNQPLWVWLKPKKRDCSEFLIRETKLYLWNYYKKKKKTKSRKGISCTGMCSSLQRNWQTRSTWHCIPAFASTTSTNWVHTWVCGFSALSGHFTIQSQLLIYCFIFLDINFDLCVWSHLSHQRPQSTTHITDFHTSCYFSLKTAWLSVDRAHSLA